MIHFVDVSVGFLERIDCAVAGLTIIGETLLVGVELVARGAGFGFVGFGYRGLGRVTRRA